MEIEEIIEKFKKNLSNLEVGSGALAKLFNTNVETIIEAKRIVKSEGFKYKRPSKCCKNTIDKIKDFSKKNLNTTTNHKILILDIETSPMMSYIWGIWNQNINLDAIINEWFVITWAAKWLGDDKIITGKLTPKEVLKEDDKRIIKDLWNLLEEATIIVTHNGDKFDFKKINTRFLLHELTPPSPYHSIDTLKIVRKHFSFTSNKLDYVNKILGLSRKIEHEGLELWIKCLRGDEKALDKMEEYNSGDVFILEELYLILRPWIKNHPNINIDNNKNLCPTCGSNKLTKVSEFGKNNKYSIYRCKCGALSKGNNSIK